MEKIFYNIDNIIYENSNEFNGIKVDGWAFDSQGRPVEIRFIDNKNYLWMRVPRKDVQDVYGKYQCSLNVGFHLEICDLRDADILKLELTNKEKVEMVSLELKNIGTKKERKFLLQNLVNASAVIDSLRMRITNRICYRIENFWLDTINDNLILSGWAFDDSGASVIRLLEPYGEIIHTSRHDVKDYYAGKCSDAMCGFEIKIPCKKELSTITLEIGGLSTGLYLNFDIERIKDIAQCPKNENGNFLKRNIDWIKSVRKYGIEGAKYKEHEYRFFLEESNLNRATYQYHETEIPTDWIAIQKKDPVICVIIPVKNVSMQQEDLQRTIFSIAKQTYCNFNIIFSGSAKDLELITDINCDSQKVVCHESSTREEAVWSAIKICDSDYFAIVESGDILSKNYLFSFVEAINLFDEKTIYFSDYDVIYNGEILFPVKRKKYYLMEARDKILRATAISVKFAHDYMSYDDMIDEITHMAPEKMLHLERIFYHENAITDQWKQNMSRIIAFYLPQFHENPENNAWWGKGFTEWVNVKRAYPMFEGHNQPRIPGELGYYDLVEDKSVQHKQVELAIQNDIFGFCFYYYWFKGRRLLRKPLDQYLQDHSLRLPFCICWANETWSRRWDGAEKEILVQQVHNEKTDIAFIYDILPILKDERYIKIDGKPILLIYRIELFPRPFHTISTWKKICKKEGIGDIHIALVQSFGMVDHRIYGADSSVEFPPHKIIGGTINNRVLNEEQKKDYTGNIYSYKEIVDNQMLVQKREYNLWPGCMLGWDNTARRLNAANVFHEFSPELYRKWLIKSHTYTQLYNSNPYIFVNAWNEWAEGTYLEPDQKYGNQLLEISKEVVHLK